MGYLKQNLNSKKGKLLLSSLFLLALLSGAVFAVTIAEDLHLNLQVLNSNGSIAQSTTFAFAFNISNSTDCAVANIVYSNLTTRDTDSRGMVSVYLNNITMDFNMQYWLCYYRNGTLIDTVSFAKSPYSFRTTSVNLTNVTANSNFSTAYNITAHTFLGQLNASNITNDIWISWAEAINGTLASWTQVTNGTMASWANAVNGTLTTWVQSINGTLARTDAANTFGAFNQTFDTNLLFLNNNANRIGIGTTTPQNTFNVIGDINVTSGGSLNGTYNFNGGWQSNGLTIQNGDIYAQTAYVYNLTSLTVNNLAVNGSIIPQTGWDNVFDIGNATNRYRNLTLGGNASINGSVYIFNNLTIGDTTSDYVIFNALVDSNIVPIDNARDLGTSANRWQVAYVDVLNANSIAAGEVNISGTNFDTFSIHTNNTGDDQRNSSLALERGTPSINAVLKWDSTNGSKRFEFNFPVYLQPDTNLTIDNFFFVDSLNNRLGIGNTTPASTLTVQGTLNLSNASNYQVITSSADGNITVGRQTPILFIDAISNRTGIGTSTPQNTLNTVGDINATTSIFSQGNNLSLAYFYATNNTWNANYSNFSTVYGYATNSTSWSQVTNGTMASWANAVNGTLTTWVQSINGTLARTDAANTFGAFNQTFDTSTFFISADGDRVGVGITSPQNKLNVKGTGALTNISSGGSGVSTFDSGGDDLIIESGGQAGLTIATPNNVLGMINFADPESSNPGQIIYTHTTDSFSFSTAGTGRMTIASDGNLTVDTNGLFVDSVSNRVGIETTAPQNTLNVIGTLNVTNGTNSFGGLIVNSNNRVGIGVSGAVANRLHINESTASAAVYIQNYGGGDFLVIDDGTTERFRFGNGGIFFIGDTANTGMGQGLTINQGTADSEILALKSSDVVHGITNSGENDTYASFQKISATNGGLFQLGFSEATRALYFEGIGTTDDTTHSTVATGYIELVANKKSGTGRGAPGTDANLVVVQSNGLAKFIVDQEGDTWQDGTITADRMGLGQAADANQIITVTQGHASAAGVRVVNSATAGQSFQGHNSHVTAGSSDIFLATYDRGGTADAYGFRLRSDEDGTPDVEFSVATSGALLSDVAASTPADYAEWTRVVGNTTSYQFGDIVGFSSENRKVEKLSSGSDKKILGAITLMPGLVGISYDIGLDVTDAAEGMDYKEMEVLYNAKMVALMGYTPIKVSTENGPLFPGDPIALSSIPGVGMKARPGQSIVGYAFESFDPENNKMGTHDVDLPTPIDGESFHPVTTIKTTPNGQKVWQGWVFSYVSKQIAPLDDFLINNSNDIKNNFVAIKKLNTKIETLTVENQNLKVNMTTLMNDNAAMKHSLCQLGATEWC